MYGPITDPEAAQFRFFDAYATFMRIAAGEQPTLVVLDDLHWADKPTLLLLQHVARELGRMRVLIVGTYRDTELARTHPLSEALAELNRGEGLARVSLRGLTAQEVASYIREAANVEPSPALVEQVFEEKEGNPFFLSQVVNLMTEEGTIDSDSVSDIAIPEGVREALGRRLDRLSEEANELLTVAAVVGREFTYDTLTLLQQRDDEARLRLVEEGLEARVIEEGDEPGQYRFTHALMQETLLAELSTTRRVLLHGQIGEAMERRYGGRAEEQAPRLAQHFVESATLTAEHAGRALRYSRVAAEQASAAHARTQAAQHYETCLRLIEGLAATNQGLTGVESEAGEGPWASEEAEVRLALGRALTGGGGVGDSRVHLDRALDLYEAAGDASGFAQTVIAARENPTPVHALGARRPEASGPGAPGRWRPLSARAIVDPQRACRRR